MNLIQRDVNTGDLTNQVKYIRLLLSHFWKGSYNEYAVALRERMMFDKTKRSSDKLIIGVVVIRITQPPLVANGSMDELNL